MEPVDLDKALAETAKVKIVCRECDGGGSDGDFTCETCDGHGFTYLYLGATDIQTRLPKREGYPVEYRNMIPKEGK